MEKGFTITYEYGDNLYVNPTNRCNFNCNFCLRHNQHTGGSIDERIGISLPVCKQLAEMMNGTLEISSESGQGTIVWVSIPCQASLIKRKKFI